MNKHPVLKVSLITTERNEAVAIKDFIESALAQSLPPTEIVIADGGSTDGTVDIIRAYIDKGAPIKLVEAPGNRAVGRNAATKAAANSIIACTDVGSRLDRDWLKEITAPFASDPQAMAVAGSFKAEPQSDFERISATLMLQGNDQINLATWLPSSRSIAYKKAAWEKVGGYPEHTNFNEDTPFDMALKAAGYRFEDGLKAVVYWRPRSNLRDFYRQYYFYAVGDGLDGIDHLKIIRFSLIYFGAVISLAGLALSFLFLLPLVGFGLWVLRRVYGGFKKLPKLKSLLLMPILMMTYDLSQIFGFWYGATHKAQLRHSNRLVR